MVGFYFLVIIRPEFSAFIKYRLRFRAPCLIFEKIIHKTGLKLFFCANFFFGIGYPVVYAVMRRNAVLPVKQRKYQAIMLKFRVCFPAVVGIQKLVAVV